jgi:zinc D-Ala-D-Ala carboxypeptidase
MYDDIPEAKRRDSITPETPSTFPTVLVIGGGIAIAAIATGIFAISRLTAKPTPSDPGLTATSPQPAATPQPTASTQLSPTTNTASNTNENDALLGHLTYEEAPSVELAPISGDGQLRLRKAAADAYLRMSTDAAAAGVTLAPLSAFRSVSDQDDLFFRVKEERNQATANRASVSAPPGHSEHHTGYAIDIGDGARADANLSESFETTAAYQWLTANAARYSFELSFPRDNPQGVSFEPWHWRYVGDRDSLKTFYRAQQLKKQK